MVCPIRGALRFGLTLGVAVTLPVAVVAERLPLTTYTSADGLGHDHVRCAVRDSRGLLWFCTATGLTRFDGAAFTRYGPADGLPSVRVHDLVEEPDGTLWVATERGLHTQGAVGSESGEVDGEMAGRHHAGSFHAVAIAGGSADTPVHDLEIQDDGSLWAAGAQGLFRLDRRSGDGPRLRPVVLDPPPGELFTVVADDATGLWFGGLEGLARLGADGRTERVPVAATAGAVRVLLFDRRGRLWIGADGGVWLLPRVDAAGAAAPAAVPAVAGWRVRSLHQGADATMWIGTVGGLHALADGDPRATARRYTVAHGLRDETINAMAEDPAGNLWLGTDVGGAIRLVQGGLVSFGTADGLAHTSVNRLFESRDGSLHVAGSVGGFVSRSAGDTFTGIRPGLLPEVADRLRRTPTTLLQDQGGEWWLTSVEGLFRFAATDRIEELARSSPRARYGVEDGLTSDFVYPTPYEDAASDLWFATARGPRGALTRWRRVADRFEALGVAAGLPAEGVPTAFDGDLDGTLWVGWSTGALFRGRDGRFTAVPLPTGAEVTALHLDRLGRLWVATAGGGAVYAAPGTDVPAWRHLTAAEGLTTDDVRCLAEDLRGRIYVGTMRGVDRFDPATGAIRHFSTADGLAQLETTVALRDRAGALWFGTWGGLSRLVPGPEALRAPPPVWIGGVAVDDEALPLSTRGTADLEPVALPAGRHRARIDFFAPAFAPGKPMRYQYRLTDRDGAEWGTPNEQRSVVLAELGAGRHRFEVRAVDGSGMPSVEPATVTFVVPPPWWLRGWFLATVAAALAALALAAHRLRLRRVLALEQVRTRIAADLHDDLGASLSRISLLAEVARTGTDDPRTGGLLEQIGDTARGLTGRAREIVWSLNPRYDDLASLAVRLREVAGELLDAIGVGSSLAAPPEAEARRVRLRPEQRQHLLLVYKEALHNVARHAGASRVELELVVRGRRLEGAISDDGCGLGADTGADLGIDFGGEGLRNMAARVRSLGGDLTVGSPPGQGVQIAFWVPLDRGDRTKMRLPLPDLSQ